MREKLLKEFNDALLNSKVNFVNEYLQSFLKNRPNTKDMLKEHFKTAKTGADGFKMFHLCNLNAWDQCSSFVIVEIEEDKFLFGMTGYGILGPLKYEGFTYHQKRIMDVILDFFVNPEKYLFQV